MTEAALTPRPCLNCGIDLQGTFCHRCGQKDQQRRLPVRHLLHDVFHDLWHFDAKVLGTLWLLIRRPGFLTGEYLEGRRVRHVPPFRLYVVVSFIAFALLALTGTKAKLSTSPKTKVPPSVVTLDTSDPELKKTLKEASKSGFNQEVERRARWAVDHPEVFWKAFYGGLSKVMFLLMPLFAGILFLLHARRGGTYFVDHMVLSLHFHTTLFLVLLGFVGLAYIPSSCWSCLPGLALFLAPLAWLAAALQHLHQRGWFRSILKSLLLLKLYGVVVGLAVVAVLWFSMSH